jgi:predicted transposase YdaD
MTTHDIVQQLKDEGRREGRQEGRQEGREERLHEATRNNLLAIYRARFGSVPRKVHAAVERTSNVATLAKWVAIFSVRTAAEIAAAVSAKKT